MLMRLLTSSRVQSYPVRIDECEVMPPPDSTKNRQICSVRGGMRILGNSLEYGRNRIERPRRGRARRIARGASAAGARGRRRGGRVRAPRSVAAPAIEQSPRRRLWSRHSPHRRQCCCRGRFPRLQRHNCLGVPRPSAMSHAHAQRSLAGGSRIIKPPSCACTSELGMLVAGAADARFPGRQRWSVGAAGEVGNDRFWCATAM